MASASGGTRTDAVFRRRRIVVAAVALAVLALVLTVWTRASGYGDVTEAGGQSTTSTSTGSAKPSGGASQSGGIAECAAADLLVTAVTDKTTYAAGEKPVFTITLTHAGDTTCSVNVGTSQLKLVVTSGKQTIWTSSDCATGSADTDQYWNYVKTIAPGEKLESVGVTWDRTFSDKSACDASSKAVDGGGAAYWLTAYVGKVKSSGDNRTQFILR